jgi:uncharacterized glyoxalase superfamily protein PhnB
MGQDTNKRIVQPYLSFEGRCEEALEFYRKSIGAEVTTLLRYKDSPDPSLSAPETENKVMHATLRIGESTVFASEAAAEASQAFKVPGFRSRHLTRPTPSGYSPRWPMADRYNCP